MTCTCYVIGSPRRYRFLAGYVDLAGYVAGTLQEAEADRARLASSMRAWSAALRPRYTSEFKPTGLCWLPPAMQPHHVEDGVPLQKRDYERMVQQVGQRYKLGSQTCPFYVTAGLGIVG